MFISFGVVIIVVGYPSTRMSRLKQLLRKLEVENEPGLSNAQLMLMNNDLRPGEIVEGATLLALYNMSPSMSPSSSSSSPISTSIFETSFLSPPLIPRHYRVHRPIGQKTKTDRVSLIVSLQSILNDVSGNG